ncbi:hypothetical protein ACLQ2R_07900 [Streptosporangium sp. DT93]|uniref:hypothetical protein n=1 Tax=Streptosporangium sp. DT93 TaxID=3393428 RepID=UPI003CF90148
MVQTTAALLVLASLLSGATATGGAPQASPERVQVSTQASPERVRVSTQAAAPNLRACYDGNCRLTITKTARFRVHPKFGITRMSISFTSTRIRVRGTAAGSFSQSVFGANGTGTVNGIKVRVVSLSGSKAVLRLSTKR